MLEKYLQEIGLSDKESTVYLHLLNSGPSLASNVAKGTGIKRPTVYTVIESLKKKGLASESTQGKSTRFQAEPPERLHVFIERQKALLKERSEILNEVVPELKALQKDNLDRPIVRYYQGKEGVISSLEALLEGTKKTPKEKDIYFVYPKDEVDEFWSSPERKRYSEKREKLDLKANTLYTSKSNLPSDGDNIRVRLEVDKYPIKADIAIYDDKVKIHTLSDKLSGIFIESRDIADTLKSMIRKIIDLEVK